MTENQANEIIKLLKDMNEKLDRILYKNKGQEDLEEIKYTLKNISKSIK